MIEKQYADFAWEQTAALLAIDSPSGFTQKAVVWVKDAFPAWVLMPTSQTRVAFWWTSAVTIPKML
jgi:hypothetical protein